MLNKACSSAGFRQEPSLTPGSSIQSTCLTMMFERHMAFAIMPDYLQQVPATMHTCNMFDPAQSFKNSGDCSFATCVRKLRTLSKQGRRLRRPYRPKDLASISETAQGTRAGCGRMSREKSQWPTPSIPGRAMHSSAADLDATPVFIAGKRLAKSTAMEERHSEEQQASAAAYHWQG